MATPATANANTDNTEDPVGLMFAANGARERSLTDEEQASLDEHISTCGLCKGASKQFELMFRQLEKYFKAELWQPEPGSKE